MILHLIFRLKKMMTLPARPNRKYLSFLETLCPKANHLGFTLLELILYMGLLSILLLVFIQIFTSSIDVQLNTQATSSVSQDGEFILEKLNYDLHRAQNIIIPNLGEQSNHLQITIDGVNYTYEVNNGNLSLTNGSGTNTLNSYDTTVANMNFKRLGSESGKNTITMTFTLTSKTILRSGPDIKDFQITVGLR